MATTTALDILYHHAARNISAQTTLNIARLALLDTRESRSEPIVDLAKDIVRTLHHEMQSTLVYEHPIFPPTINLPKLLMLIPIFREWDVDIPRYIMDTGLHYAMVYEEPLETIQCLIDAGAHPNEVIETAYFSPLMIAARKGRADMVALLLKAGADKDYRVGYHTALSLAVDPVVISLLV